MNNNNYYYSFSMLHQTLAVSSPSCSSFPLKLSSSTVSPLRSSQVEEETSMEALKSCSRPKQQQQQGAFDEEVAWAVESGNLPWWEEFSVDDLLNLEFVENEKEADGEVAAFVEHQETDEPNSASSAISSSLSFEPPPPPLVSGINLPAHDAKEFEWVSIIMDDSLSEFPSCAGVASLPSAPQSQDETGCRTENSATKGPSFVSPTVCILSTEAMVPVKAKRSKRSRSAAAAWSKSGPLPFAESSSDSSSVSSCSSTTMPSYLVHDRPSATGDPGSLLCDRPPPAKRQKLKKRGRKPKSPSSSATDVPGERRCTHCGAQKTPQWRAGPLGAKTLCNACGVRFKSGRLLPEYRPACSPTFVSHIHSNCHRKVLEMRREKEAGLPLAAVAPPVPSF